MNPGAKLLLVCLVWVAVSGSARAQYLPYPLGQVDCAQEAFTAGLSKTAPLVGPSPGCPGGAYLINMSTQFYLHVENGAVVKALYQEELCTFNFFLGSYTPSVAPLGLRIYNWCSPSGLAEAFFVGTHEGHHANCGLGSSSCEEIAADLAAIDASCDTVSDAVKCLCDDDCEDLLSDFPDFVDESGELDKQGIRDFADALCKRMESRRDALNSPSGRIETYICACGGYNDEAPPGCQVPVPPGGCDGTVPGEGEAPYWPADDECGSCQALESNCPGQ